MCCIFTCVGWMIDLIQRLWVFAMSCCISSAIGCLLMTASLSGIALGYNYSLSEYIDLKETNVSVYLKRGVFDDEIADDFSFRRAGHMPVAGHINDENLMTGPPADKPDEVRSGRRLDNSVFNSNDQNNFEGALMKLTVKPLDQPITPITYTSDVEMNSIDDKLDDLNKMKAIQGILNKRRFNVISATSSESARRMMNNPETPPKIPPNEPTRPIQAEILSGRRFDPYDPKLYHMFPGREAVPDRGAFQPKYWSTPPALRNTKQQLFLYNEIYPLRNAKVPQPIPVNLGPRRPSTPSEVDGRRQFTGGLLLFTKGRKENVKDNEDEGIKSGDETDRLGQRIQQELSRHKSEEYPQKSDEDYDVNDKGLPVRKKRHIKSRDGSDSPEITTKMSSPAELSNSPDILSDESKITPTLMWLITTLKR